MTPLEILYNGVVERGGKMMQKGKISNGVTRRKFIHKLIKAGSAIIVGAWWLAKKAAPRKFVRALRVKKYPGSLSGPAGLRDISKQSKWSG